MTLVLLSRGYEGRIAQTVSLVDADDVNRGIDAPMATVAVELNEHGYLTVHVTRQSTTSALRLPVQVVVAQAGSTTKVEI